MADIDQIRKDCESDLFLYAQIMFPNRYFGDVHSEMFRFFQNSLEKAMKKHYRFLLMAMSLNK